MQKLSILSFLILFCTNGFCQDNVFGHYETPTVSAQLLHLRPDSTYVLYFVSDIGFPRPKYKDIPPKPFKVSNGQIILENETTGFDSIFILVDSLNLVPKTNSNRLVKRVFYHDDGTIKYYVDPNGLGYDIRYYRDRSLIRIDKYEDLEMNGEHLEYYPMSDPLSSDWYQAVLEEGDSLNWQLLTAFMGLNAEFHQIKKTEGQWKNGKKHGIWKHYGRDGELLRKDKYREGVLKNSR